MRIEIPKLTIVIENAREGDNLLALLALKGVPIARSCGGDGVCASCAVWISGDDVPEVSSAEKRLLSRQHKNPQMRIACLVKLPSTSKTWVIDADYW